MELLTKKTTLLLSPAQHRHLSRVARARRTSLGQLVRDACEIQYGSVTTPDRMRAAAELTMLSLPVASPKAMKRQSVPDADDLLP